MTVGATTVMVKEHELVLPLASVAVQRTGVTPTGKVAPLGGSLTRLVTAQLSLAATSQVTLFLLHCPASALSVMLTGQVTAGGVSSATRT